LHRRSFTDVAFISKRRENARWIVISEEEEGDSGGLAGGRAERDATIAAELI